MIVGQPTSVRDRILRTLEDSEFVFHLTGSRYFGTARPDSDTDLFVGLPTDRNDYHALTRLLGSLEFKATSAHDYTDIQTVQVYRHALGIDVQIVKDATVKADAQAAIRASNLLQVINKGLDRYVWDLAYRLIRGT
jgi:hypothetical protein